MERLSQSRCWVLGLVVAVVLIMILFPSPGGSAPASHSPKRSPRGFRENLAEGKFTSTLWP